MELGESMRTQHACRYFRGYRELPMRNSASQPLRDHVEIVCVRVRTIREHMDRGLAASKLSTAQQ